MKKILLLAIMTLVFSTVSFAIAPITGIFSGCTGTTVYLDDSLSPGGTWTSSNPLVATIGLTTADVNCLTAGITTITYSVGGSSTTATFTVSVSPPPVIGAVTSLCPGTTIFLSDITSGGTWSSDNNYIATVDPVTGVVYGANHGNADISYSLGGACTADISVMVNGDPPSGISVPSVVCASGGMVTLTDTVITSGITGGTWSSSNTGIATINATTGVVTGVSAGTVTITYLYSGVCATETITTTINVSNTTDAGVISGTTNIFTGGSATLNETAGGGTWSSSNLAVANINATTGTYSGVSTGTSVITYTANGCGGIAYATYTITVMAIDGISGYVKFPGTPNHRPIKVWLITYNPGIGYLEATDSATYNGTGDSIYYQFLSVATDSYRVKAAITDTFTTTTGYIPTYHTSSFYWYAADVIYHTTGTGDINKDINMMSGTTTTGIGFIGGYISAGANRGTSTTGIPVNDMSVNLFNSSNQLIKSTVTDATGSYSFSNLPLDTYYVFPDSLNYVTTAYTGITLTSGASYMSAASFTQHTLSRTITPNTTGISNVTNIASSVLLYPNPATDELTIQMTDGAYNSMEITNNVGQVLMRKQLTGSVMQVNVKELPAGMYYVTMKGDNGSAVRKFVKM